MARSLAGELEPETPWLRPAGLTEVSQFGVHLLFFGDFLAFISKVLS
jgi:hypothetical protein